MFHTLSITDNSRFLNDFALSSANCLQLTLLNMQVTHFSLLETPNNATILIIQHIPMMKEVVQIKITVDANMRYEDLQVKIQCPKANDRVQQLVDWIETFTIDFLGKSDDKLYTIQANDIFYIESVDNKTFLYCDDQVYENDLKLYEIEERTDQTNMIRISKNMILNTEKVASVRALFNGKFEATLVNDEKVIVNRHYVKSFKAKFLK